MQSNQQAQLKRAELESYGLTSDNDQYRVNIKEYTSTITFAAGASITGQLNFFQQGTVINAYNTHTFPRNETAVEILGIKVDHNLQLASSEVALLTTSKQNKVFEQYSRLTLNYGQVANRFDMPVATLCTWMSAITGDGALTTYGKTNSGYNDGYWRFPVKTTLKIGAKQEALWQLDTRGINYTLAAADAAGANANISALPVIGGVFYITCSLLVKEYADAKS